MVRRLPRYAELKLQSLCAEAGALCHAVDEDESGWDRLIEFPSKPFVGPADTRPPPASAYAQVKSSKGSRLSCKIKLSNALRAAQHPQPWFIVLVTAPAPDGAPKVYAIHVWEDLIRRTLAAVRRAENSKRSLHTAWLTITFQGCDERADIVEWMQSTIDAVGPEYEAAKRAINRTAGYEDGGGDAKITIEADSQEEIFRNFLGLGSGLRFTKFTYTPARFGIRSPKPEINATAGTVHITPPPVGEVDIQLRTTSRSRPIVRQGHVYGMGIPGLPRDQQRLRFSAGFFEILWKADSECEFRATMNSHKKYDLALIEDYLALGLGAAAGPIEVRIWSSGQRLFSGTLQGHSRMPNHAWPVLASAVQLLRSITGHERAQVSVKDLHLASGLRTIVNIFQAPSFRIEFEPREDAPTRFAIIVYWFQVVVGEYTFYAMAEHDVVEDIFIDDGWRRVTAKPGRIVDSYVLMTSSASNRNIIEADYARRLASLGEHQDALDLANLLPARHHEAQLFSTLRSTTHLTKPGRAHTAIFVGDQDEHAA